jgi:hypothetical protein
MDKKILLSGAAALLLGASLFAAPASAALSLSHSGESKITATMTDNCTVTAATDLTALSLDIGTVNGLSAGTDATDTGTIDADDVAVRSGTCAANVNEDNPVWATSGTSLDWSASGTLANGLSVSVDQDAAITLGGNFGTLTFKKDGDSAVKSARANGAGDTTVTGLDLGGHSAATSGTAGMVVNWKAPSVGGVDLWVSYAPNAADTGLDSSDYKDTFAIGGALTAGDMTISAGFENASTTATCAALAARDVGDFDGNLAAQINGLLGGSACGDMTLTAVGASMSAAGLTIDAGWSELDSDGSDKTVMNIGLGTTVGAYDLSLNWVDAEKTYTISTLKDEQTTLGVGISTSLGDGVSLGLDFSTNDYNLAGKIKDSNYHAEAALTIKY